MNTTDCKTICLSLGPYRNLTSLTTATLFLHPNCQVLNHGAASIFGNEQVDFLKEYTPEKIESFLQRAISLSADGERGPNGGSIMHSHACDPHHPMASAFSALGGLSTLRGISHSVQGTSPACAAVRYSSIDRLSGN